MTDPIEQIFKEVAMMTPAPPKDDDPYQSEEYAKFAESMIPHCHCDQQYRPCDGVLAGGLCDDLHTASEEREHYDDCDEDSQTLH